MKTISIAVLALSLVSAAPYLQAAPVTWTGSTDNLWSVGGNWSGLPVSGDSLVLTSATGAGGLNLNNDLTSGSFNLAGITYNSGAAAFVIGDGTATLNTGNPFVLTGNVANNSANLQTINNPFSLTASRTFTTTTGGGDIILGGNISGTGGGISKNGIGTMTLKGTNSFSGDVTVNAGTLKAGSSGAFGGIGSSALVMNGQSTFDLDGFDATVGRIFFGTGNNTQTTTLSTGAGTLTITGTAGGNGNISQDVATSTAKVLNGNINLGGGTRTINNQVGTWTVNANLSNGTLNQTGGTILYTATGSTHATILTGGTYQLANNSAAGTGTLTFSNGGLSSDGTTARTISNQIAFSTNGNANVGNAVNNGKITFANTVDTGSSAHNMVLLSDAQFDGDIAGSGRLSFGGAGSAILNHSGNTMTGTGQIGANGGYVKFLVDNQFPNTPAIFLGGAGSGSTVDLNGTNQTAAALIFAEATGASNATLTTGAGTLTITGSQNNNGIQIGAFGINANFAKFIQGNLNLNGGTRVMGNVAAGLANKEQGLLTVSAVMSNGGLTILKSDAPILLTGANTHSLGTTLSNNSAFPARIGVGNLGSVGSITSSAFGTGTLTFNGGYVSSDSSTARTVLNSITFTGDAKFGDATNNGKLTFSADAALGGAVRTLTVNSEVQFDGVFSGTGGLSKAGPSILTLTGDNIHTGQTGVTAGRLVLTGNNIAAIGGMSITGGIAQFTSPASINGTARNVTVTAPGTVLFDAAFGAANITSALLNRITASSTGAIAADNYAASDFDFGTAGLTAASLGAVSNVTYTGILPPNATTSRLGGGGGILTIGATNVVTGVGFNLLITPNGTVILAAPNDLTGTTTISATGTLQLGTGLVGQDGSVASPSIVDNGILHVKNFGNQTYAGMVSGTGDLTKSGPGTLTLTDFQTYTGTTTVNEGTLELRAGNHTLAVNRPLVVNGGVLDLGSNQQYVGSFNGTGGVVTATSGGRLTINQPNAASSYAGSFQGAMAVTKAGQQTLTLTGDSTTTGSFSVIGGGVTLKDNGALSGATGSITVNSATLTLDNNGTVGNNNRIHDGKSLELNGATFNYLGRNSSSSTETLGAVSLTAGVSIIDVRPGTGTASSILTLGSLARSAGATLNVNPFGNNLGTTTNPYANVVVTGGLVGNLAPVNGVVPGVLSANQDDWNLVGYDNTKGFGRLGTAGFPTTTSNFATAGATSNVQGGATGVVSSDLTVNAINQTSVTFSNGTTVGGTDRLTIASGMVIMSTQTFGTVGSRGRITSGTSELFIGHRDGNATPSPIVHSVVEDNGNPVSLVVYSKKGDRGPYLELTAANTHSGGTFVSGGNNQGGILLNAGSSTQVIPAGGLTINNLGIVDMAGFQGQINPANVVTINGGGALRLMGTNTLAGLVFNSNGGTVVPTVIPYNTITRDANTNNYSGFGAKTGTLVITGNITSTPSNVAVTPLIDSGTLDLNGSDVHDITVNALPEGTVVNTATTLTGLTISSVIQNGGFTKKGGGVLNLTGANTYAGNTVIEAGLLIVTQARFNNSSTIKVGTAPAANAKLRLAFAGTDIVDALFIDGVQQPAGTYGSTASSAANRDDNTFDVAGTGILDVQNGPPLPTGYAVWASTRIPSGSAAPEFDYDSDGLDNALEYVMGTDPGVANPGSGVLSVERLPGSWTASFQRDLTSKSADTAIAFEVGGDLATWPDVYTVGTDTATSSPGVTIGPGLSVGFETVTLTRTITAAEIRKYARLRVTVTLTP